MKKFRVLIGLLITFVVFSCSDSSHIDVESNESPKTKATLATEDEDISNFEKSYIEKYLSNKSDETKLLGYKTMLLSGEEKEIFKDIYEYNKESIDSERGVFVASDFSFYRIYFPMHTAIAELNGKEYMANENGIIKISVQERGNLDCLNIKARKKSDKVTGCGSNIITDTKIILQSKLVSARFAENTYIFDMGNINCCETKGGVSCTKNHGSYANCSDAFGIWGDNCVTQRNVCMDFNGFFSDCIKGPKTYFVGSDCQRSMALGHCWNEIM